MVIEHTESFKVQDATGQNLAYLYFEDEPIRKTDNEAADEG